MPDNVPFLKILPLYLCPVLILALNLSTDSFILKILDLNIMKRPLRMPKLPLAAAAISFILFSDGCKKPTLDSTPVGLEIEFIGSNWDLSLCNKFHEGLKDAELEISVDRYTGDANNPLENFKTYFHDIDNDTDKASNRVFKDIDVPKSGPFAISVVIRQVCSDCCKNQTSGPSCPDQKRGRPRFKGMTGTYDSGAGNPPPAKILIEEKFIQCTACGC